MTADNNVAAVAAVAVIVALVTNITMMSMQAATLEHRESVTQHNLDPRFGFSVPGYTDDQVCAHVYMYVDICVYVLSSLPV